ncbi:hypothetical protein LEN26_015476 [Aphanomyces euteiches]|nr:hypothetical protein LEN26_015476 [Aphanomyces euteiches]KAH9112820.1 hypothetical protein AeMF1_012921 [Aphanomyces euteiches]KAH9186957.1 hypothetical protein AeNC1_011071 [Aphanomyces euteiches]
MESLTTTEEWKALLQLAVPKFLSTLSVFSLSLTEMIVAGHLGTSEMTAVAFSQIIFDFSIIVFSQGFNRGLNALGSQAVGAKSYHLLGRYTQMGCLGLTIMTVPMGILWWFVGDFLRLAGVSPASIVLAQQYAHLSTLTIWPRLIFQFMTVYFDAQQIALPTAVISITFVLLHLGINVLFVFGVPAWNWTGIGFLGMPFAMIVTSYVRLIVYLLFMMAYRQYHRASWVWNLDFLDTKFIIPLIQVGLPLALGQTFENAQLQTMALMASVVSEISLDAHNAMIGLIFFLTSPIYGLSGAGVIRIAIYLGANKPKEAKHVATLVATAISSFSIVTATILLLNREYVGHLFSKDAEIWTEMTQICTFAAAGYVILSLFYSSMAVLVAQARALPILLSFFTGAWIVGVPAAYFIGVSWKVGLLGIWIGMALGYGVTTAISLYASLTANWDEEATKAVTRSKEKEEKAKETTRLLATP